MISKDAMVDMPDEAVSGIDLALSKFREQIGRALNNGGTEEGMARLLANLEAAERWWLTVGYNQAKMDGVPL